MSGNLVETIIGALVLVVAAVFLVFAYNKSDIHTVSGYSLMAKFEKIDGINVGSDVTLGGIKVGTVVDQRLDKADYLAIVEFSIEENLQLPSDSNIKVVSDGLLGSKYLSIEPGGNDEMLKAGDEIRFTQGALDLTELIGKAIYNTGTGGKAK